MRERSDRVVRTIRQGRFRVALLATAWLVILTGAGRAEDSLAEFEIFGKSIGEWEGIGVSFDIVNGELREPVTFRDRWEARLKEKGRLMEMRGTTRAGGRRIGYLWRFRWQPGAEKITGEFENSEGVASTVEVKAVAEGKRLEIRTPASDSEKEAGGMRMDIYLEDEDIVIESAVLDADGKETYRAAARYRKTE